MNEEGINIREIINALKKRWKLIFGMTILATTISALITIFVIKPQYKANSKIIVSKENSESSSDVEMYQQLIQTYSELIRSLDLIQGAIDTYNIDISANEVFNNLTVTSSSKSLVLNVSYISTDRELARDVIEAVTKQFVATAGDYISNGKINVMQKVRLPNNPISPNKKMNIGIAVVIGFVLGVILALLLELLDNTFKSREQVEEYLGIPVVGIIPESENDK